MGDDEVRVTAILSPILSLACTAGDGDEVGYLCGSPTLRGASLDVVSKGLGAVLCKQHGTTPERLEAAWEKLAAVPVASQQVATLESETEKLAEELDLSNQEVKTAQKVLEQSRQTLETAMKRNNVIVKKVDTANGKLAGARDELESAKVDVAENCDAKMLSALQEGGVRFDKVQVSSAISEHTHASNGRNSRLALHTQQVGRARVDEDDGDNDEEYEHEEAFDAEGKEECEEEAGASDDGPAVASGSPDSDSAIKEVRNWALESPANLPDNITNEEWEEWVNVPVNVPVTTGTPGRSPSPENLENNPFLIKRGGGKVTHGTLLKTPEQVPPPPSSNAEGKRPVAEEEDDKAKRKRNAEGKLPVAEEEEQPEAEKKRPKPSSRLATRGASSSKKQKAPNGKISQGSVNFCNHARTRSNKAKAKAAEVATPEAPDEEEEHDKLKFLNYLEEELGPDNDIVKKLKTAHERGDAATFTVHKEEWYDLSKLPEIRDKFGDWNKKMMPTKGGVGFILQFEQTRRPGHFCNFTRPLNEIYADLKRLKDTYPDHGYDLGNPYETFNKKFDRNCITSRNRDETEEPYYCTKGGRTNCFENLRTVCERCTKPILDWERAYQIQVKKRELAESERDHHLQSVDEDKSDTEESQSGDNSQ